MTTEQLLPAALVRLLSQMRRQNPGATVSAQPDSNTLNGADFALTLVGQRINLTGLLANEGCQLIALEVKRSGADVRAVATITVSELVEQR